MRRSGDTIATLSDVQAAHKPMICTPACRPGHQAAESLPAQAGHFFTHIFDTSDWPARWHCGTWSDFHGWLYIASDLLIWASYFAIPFLLIRVITRRADIPFPKIIWLFIAFIILCGTSHLIDAIIFWWPAYRLSALIRLCTGIVSGFTVFALYKVTPMLLSLRSVDELEREIKVRRAAEEKLAASEFLLKEAGRLARMGGWEYDPVTKKTIWSQALYDIYEVNTDFKIDEADPFSFFLSPYNQQLISAASAALNEGTGWDLELQMLTAKGTVIWVRSYGESLYNESGNMFKLRGVLIDIDKYKTNETDLSKSNEMLSQSHQQLKSFTHILSHNIRNHSSNISLLTDLVETQSLTEDNCELFDKLTKVSHSLNTTLDDLTEAIKIRENTISAEWLTFKAMCNHVLVILEQEIAASQAQIKFSFKVEKVLFPKIYLESILLNLISNAIKYRQEQITPLITLNTFEDQFGYTVLTCTDNGQGINLDLHAGKIFGLYKTFHAHKDAHGVGLFLVKSQVESQGGTISIKSTVGEGTTFKITFRPPDK